MNTILKLGPNSVVSQPGDPLLSPDGNVSVSANNDGTATVAKKRGLSASHDVSGSTVQFENTAAELAAGVAGGIRFKFTTSGTTYDCTAPFWYSSDGFSDYGPISGGPANWSNENVEIDTSGVSAFYGDAVFAPWTTVDAGGSSTAIIATNKQVNAAIATINNNFDGINTFLCSYFQPIVVSITARASGYSFSSDGTTWDNKAVFYHWGQLGCFRTIFKCTSEVAIGGREIGTISIPSGYSLRVAGIGASGGISMIRVNTDGSMGLRNWYAFAANTSNMISVTAPLSSIADRFTRTRVSTI